MAAELVGGAFLSAFLQVLFDRIASPEVVNFIRGKKLNEKLIKKLKIKLHTVNAVLHDAENKQIRNPAVKEWLDDLEDAVFDADDLLDEIATRARRKRKRKVRNPFSTSINSYQRKIEEVLHRLEFIAKQKKYLGLKEDVGGKLSPKTPTTSLVEESNVYGRDDEKEAIIKLLLSDDVGGSKICVIPIVGMGGLGKTTLAQFAYNDDRVEEKFDLKAWVCVSEEFGVLKITKMVLEAVTSYACEINDLNLLQLKLKERLTGKKFLLVLDDIWSDNYVDWHSLQSPFQYGALGSKIIMTTRNEKVALIMQTVPAYHLRHLSNEDCWLLFANHAFNNSKVDPNLEIVGREIVKRCRGLPLAAKALGGLLRWKSDVEDWNAILKSDLWNLPEYESNVLPALQLSYHHLPSNLKRCFAYCAIFPKGYEFRKEELILLWMAENFLQSPTRNKRMEDVGDEYFHDLVSRSFLQQSSSDNSCFIMHDLIHDLAKHIAGKLCFMLEDDEAQVIAKRTRHLSYSNFITGNWTFMNFEEFFASKNLRTFLVLCPQFSSHIFPFHVKITHDLLPNLRFLRVLSLSRYNAIETLPDSIGGLILLRYLDISFTKIKKLPESLSTLYNLQSLKLLMCYCLTMLPRNIHNCINMRYIDISRTPLQEMPRQMSKLKSLQFLSHFVVGRERGSKIGELGELSDLRGTLSIEKLQNVLNSKDASEAKVKDKKYLEELKLKWDLYASRGDSLHERDILDKLQPDTYLKRLSIFGYGGARFPDWLGHGSYHNMVSLCLYGCRNCSLLPPLGQLTSLKCLQIMSFEKIVTVGQEFYNNGYLSMKKPFLSLETLSFCEMLSWQQWFSFEVEGEVGPFPNLRELCVVDCPRLTGDLPIFLPSLTRLEITNCQQLTSSLPRTPEIRELQVIPYPEVALKQLDFKGCRLLESLFEAMTLNETCLERLSISGCSSSMAFPHGCLPTSMKKLDIAYCEKLEFPMHQCP
ncbi:putative LRR and NB-ARC domains-containing disease resistance protein [Quillaja saponaria]|uniref:LRR and NB-ARC domains-containing disease resistance protein n=1 Tax=Quillaja saponaria TaxID=32244 RepID=A0AAD7L0F8_QUISA|nr:putative LRR and NB-ARC domains-containing disease resistance protein [Quillaja saponaria]